MKPKKIQHDYIYQIVFALACATLLICLILFTDLGDFIRKGDLENEFDFSAGWRTASGRSLQMGSVSAEQFGGHAALTKALPDTLKPNESLCFSSNNAKLTVWIGGAEAYRFEPVENLTGKGYGTAYHTINLAPEYAGQTVRIEMDSVFDNHSGGRIRGPYLCGDADFYRMLIREQFLPGLISIMVIFLSLMTIALHFGLKGNILPYNLVALGISTFLIGLWCLVDCGLPQIMTGCIYAGRVLDYSLLHLTAYPLICFVSSITKQKRRGFVRAGFFLFLFNILLLLVLCFIAGFDMHMLIPLVYYSYFSPIVLAVVILADDRRYCRKNGLTMNLRHFYSGAACLVAGGILDIVLYLSGMHLANGHGNFLRIGLFLCAAELLLQIFHWWASERTSFERDRFINRVLQYAMSTNDAEGNINAALEYLGTELHADRAYIFEEMPDGTFDNTYEWCRAGVSAEIDNLKGLPYDGVVDVWYNEYRRANHILIYDIEAYHAVSEGMYNVLKPQGIETLVTGPLEVNGKYIGFFGVDNPPAEMMKEISEIIRLLSYFLSQMVLQRVDQKRLIRYSYYDAMTGCRNRRALEEFEKQRFDPSRSYGFIMCDVNGLKTTNDTVGHEAGDALIIDVANSLREVFGAESVYRVGGDEFVVYTYRDSEASFTADLERAKALIEGKGRSAAMGAVFRSGGDPDYERVKAEADALMYENKRLYYQGRNDRRR